MVRVGERRRANDAGERVGRGERTDGRVVVTRPQVHEPASVQLPAVAEPEVRDVDRGGDGRVAVLTLGVDLILEMQEVVS